MNGAPGMPLGAMAQLRPCFLSVGQSSGATSSTEAQPSALATSQVLLTSHFSPATLKHQKTMDCLRLPFSCAFSSAKEAAVRDSEAETVGIRRRSMGCIAESSTADRKRQSQHKRTA